MPEKKHDGEYGDVAFQVTETMESMLSTQSDGHHRAEEVLTWGPSVADGKQLSSRE